MFNLFRAFLSLNTHKGVLRPKISLRHDLLHLFFFGAPILLGGLQSYAMPGSPNVEKGTEKTLSHLSEEAALIANPAQDLYQAARYAYQEAIKNKDLKRKKQFFGVAGRQFTRFIHNHTGHSQEQNAWYYLARCHKALNSPTNATHCLKAILKKWPTGAITGLAAYQLAEDHYQKKTYLEAAKLYQLSARESTHKETIQRSLFKTALCFKKLDTKSPEGALEQSLKTLLKDPTSPYRRQAQYLFADLYSKQANHQKALDLFHSLAQSPPNDQIQADSLLQVAHLANHLKQTELAQRSYQKVLSTPLLTQWYGQAQLALIRSYYQTHSFEQIIDEHKKTMSSPSSYTLSKKEELHRLLLTAKAYEQLNQTKQALPLYQSIAEKDPAGRLGFEAAYMTLSSRASPPPDFKNKAQQFLTQYQSQHPNDPRIHQLYFMLGEHFYAQKNYSLAAQKLQLIQESLLPQSALPTLHFKQADCLQQLRNYSSALGAWDQFLSTYTAPSVSPDLLLLARSRRAQIHEHNQDFEHALSDYKAISTSTLAHAPRSESQQQHLLYSLLHQASIFQQTERFSDLIQAHETLLKQIPKRTSDEKAQSHFWMGWAYFKQKQYDQALTNLTKSRNYSPTVYPEESSLYLTLSHYQLEQAVELEQELTSFINTYPSSAQKIPKPLFAWLGLQLAQKKEFSKALPFLQQGLTLNEPKQTAAPVWRAAALTFSNTHNYQEALLPLRHLLTLETSPWKRAQLYQLQAHAFVQLRRYQEALDAANQGLQIKPNGELNQQLRFHLGEAYLGLQKAREAAKQFVIVTEFSTPHTKLNQKATQHAILALKKIGDEESLKQAISYQKKLNTP